MMMQIKAASRGNHQTDEWAMRPVIGLLDRSGDIEFP